MHLRVVSLAALLLLLSGSAIAPASAQSPFPQVFAAAYPFEHDYRYIPSDGSYFLGMDRKNFFLLDATTGKLLWQQAFAPLAGKGKWAGYNILRQAGLLLVSTSESGADQIIALDLATGARKWTNADFKSVTVSSFSYHQPTGTLYGLMGNALVLLDAATGKQKTAVALPEGKWSLGRTLELTDENELLVLVSKVNLAALVGKGGWANTLISLDLNTMKVRWQQTFANTYPIKSFSTPNTTITSTGTLRSGAGSSLFACDLTAEGNRVYFQGRGLLAFDRATGKQVWERPYSSFVGRGLMGGGKPTYDAVAGPILAGDKLYSVVFEKEGMIGKDYQKSVTQANASTGATQWEVKLDDDKDLLVPNMLLVGNVLVLQKGGLVNVQVSNDNGSVSYWEWQGPFGLVGLDAATGKQLWATPEYKDQLTEMALIDGKLYACDAKNLYAFDPATGKALTSFELGKTKMGKPNFLQVRNGRIFLMCTEGIAVYDPQGKLLLTYSDGNDDLKETEYSVDFAGRYFVVDGKKNLAFFDATTLQPVATIEQEKDQYHRLGPDGDWLMVFDEKRVVRYKL